MALTFLIGTWEHQHVDVLQVRFLIKVGDAFLKTTTVVTVGVMCLGDPLWPPMFLTSEWEHSRPYSCSVCEISFMVGNFFSCGRLAYGRLQLLWCKW